MTAKQYLMQYRLALSELRCKESERQTLYEKATNISPSLNGSTPTAGSVSDKVGIGATSIAALDETITSEISQMQQMLRDIRDTVNSVSDVQERNLLTYYYICGYTWERTAVEMNYSYAHVVTNLHPRALRSVDRVLRKKGLIE